MDRSRPCQPRVCGPPLPAHETVAQKHPSLRVKPLARTQSRQAAAIAHRTPPLFLSDLTRSTHAETRTQRHSPARSTADSSRLHFGQPSPQSTFPCCPSPSLALSLASQFPPKNPSRRSPRPKPYPAPPPRTSPLSSPAAPWPHQSPSKLNK